MIEFLEPLYHLFEALFCWRFTLVVLLTASLIWWIQDAVPQSNLQMAICVPLGIVGFAMALFWESRGRK